LPAGHLKLFINLQQPALARVAFIFHLYFSFNDGAEIFIAKWFAFQQPADEKMRKSGRKKHFDMQMLKASCGDYDIENN